MKILAIDPGYERLGIAILEKTEKTKEVVLHSECFRTSATLPFIDRLVLIGNRINEVIAEHSPTALCIENLFLNKNQKTVMRISEVRGVILYIAGKCGLKIQELTPLQIKLAVTGSGRSGKNEMIKMIQLIIKNQSGQNGLSQKKTTDKIVKTKQLDDEFDAIATGLAYFAYNKLKP